MNAELARLLADAGVPGTIRWPDVVVLYNYAPVPPPPVRSDPLMWHRGFNLAVLSRGVPTHFVKCRPATDVVLDRENAIRSCLAGDRAAGLSVAPVRTARSDRLSVQVSRFLRGPHYGRFAPGQSTPEYLRTLRTVVDGAAELARLAQRDCPTVAPAATTVLVRDAIAQSLEEVRAFAPLAADQYAALAAAAVEAGAVPARAQHGDFWWQNVLMVDGRWWAIDFDGYGEGCVALFDDLTMACTTMGLRAPGGIEGPVRLLADDAEARACRALLAERAAAEGIAPSQLDGLLAYYVVHMAATIQRRNAGPMFSAPHVAAVRHVARRLAAGRRDLLSPVQRRAARAAPAATAVTPPTLLAVAAAPVLPVTNGYALRVSNLVRELARDWRVILAAPPGDAPQDLETLGIARAVPLHMFRGWGALGHDERCALRDVLDEVVLDESPRAAIVWAGAEAALDTSGFPPTVIDRLDSEVVIAWRELRHARGMKDRLRAARDAVLWARRERKLVRAAARTVVDADRDAWTLRWLSGRSSVHIVANGVDIAGPALASEETATPTVAFTGSMAYAPNVRAVTWFVRSVWPAVRAAVPAARFVVAGRTPAPEILALGAVPGVEIAGDVADISAVLRTAWLAIAPVRTGSGIRTKVLEAWAVGRPVVLSPVAASGMRLDGAAASLLARSAGRTARLVTRLLTHHDERHRLGAAAHALCEREYGGWARAGAAVSALLREAVADRAP